MIGSLANAQNAAQRKLLEAAGYKFSLGSDGWSVYWEADVVAEAMSRKRGEGCYEDNLDRAVFAATNHKNLREKVASVAQLTEEGKKSLAKKQASEEVKKTSLQARAVKQALAFLEQAGAEYKVVFEGETWSNMPEEKPEKIDFSLHWRPILTPFEGKGAFTVSIEVPEEYAVQVYAQSVRMYLTRTYGKGAALTEVDVAARRMDIMVAQVES